MRQTLFALTALAVVFLACGGQKPAAGKANPCPSGT